jgi:hypothetical protein
MKATLRALTRLALMPWSIILIAWEASSVFVSTQSDTDSSSDNPLKLLLSMELDGTDFTWMGPTTVCVCGGELWHIVCWFDPVDREVGGRFLEMQCVNCGSYCKSPTPID